MEKATAEWAQDVIFSMGPGGQVLFEYMLAIFRGSYGPNSTYVFEGIHASKSLITLLTTRAVVTQLTHMSFNERYTRKCLMACLAGIPLKPIHIGM